MVIVANKMKIGVVILNYNSAKDTEKCIEFLQKQKFDKEHGVGSREQGFKMRNEEPKVFEPLAIKLGVNNSCDKREQLSLLELPSEARIKNEVNNDMLYIIVVDNASNEQFFLTSEAQSHLCQSVEQCSKQGLERVHQKKEEKYQRNLCNLWEKKQIEVIYSTENRGYSAGNNIGLRRAVELGCEYVLVVNPDMELVDPHYIEKLVAVMQADEDVVVAATDIVTPEGIHQNPMLADGNWRSSFGWVTSLLRPQKRAEAYDFIGDYAKSGYCAKVSGCCLMLRCSFLQEIGYFDEYPFLYCEEAILASQVARAGKKMYYLADTQAIHRHVKSEKGDPVKRFRHWQRSRIYFYKRYSNDSWLGRQISIFSMRMYVFCFTMYKKVTNIRRQKDIRT